MAISINKFVNITSAVGAGGVVRQRDLIGRLFTANPRQPTDAVIEFTEPDDVKVLFGADSEEYRVALAYFGFITKSATRAKKFGTAAFPIAAMAPLIVGGSIKSAFASTKAALTTAGPTALVGVVIDGVVKSAAIGDVSGATSYSDLAGLMQTALVAVAPGITVAFTGNAFNVGLPAAVSVFKGDTRTASVAAASSILQLLDSQTLIHSPGSAAMSTIDIVSSSAEKNGNFATFKIIPEITESDEADIGAWLAAQNFKYLYSFRRLTVSALEEAFTALGTFPGMAAHLAPLPDEYPEVLPMALAAATDFTRRAANKNYMFQQTSGLTPSVTDTPTSNEVDAVRGNYYGMTQANGQGISFYQRGTLYGGPKDATDTNVYINEVWLKDRLTGLLMSLQLSLEALTPDPTGRGYILNTIQAAVDESLTNGVILVGKELSTLQQTVITEQSGDPLAWLSVRDLGYWRDVYFVQEVDTSGAIQYVAKYLLIYSKGDTVRRIDGSHILI